MKKREDDIARFKNMEDLLACPICADALRVLYEHAWVLKCGRRHTFNIASDGYVNLLTTHRQKASGFGKPELTARRRMLQGGLFAPLVEHIAEGIRKDAKAAHDAPLRVVDVGTGEGTVLASILRALRPVFSEVEGCGTDISVAGIRMASKVKHNVSILWVVGNALRRLPFQDRSAQVVLSILAPLDQEEAARIVAPAGFVVVVKPGEHHLRELREAIFEHDRKPPIEKAPEEGASSLLVPACTQRVQRTIPVSADATNDLIYMSPLFWKASRQNLVRLNEQGLTSITVDFEIDWFRRT